jgi:UDP-2,3-diacylglucosamine pyrophosphatase LpxH
MRAFIKFAKDLKPRALILNGDVLDFPKVSRHPSNWEAQPTVADEIEAANLILAELEDAVPRNCKLAWTLGNHDSRLETRIATVAPELAKLKGVHLKDHFSERWHPCWSVWLNDDVSVKHRWKGGMGATRANALNSGMSMVTGHLHSANVRGLTDYKGTRWGVDTGCLADPDSEAFLYAEDAPLDWRSGFAVLTFRDGKLLPPELVHVWDKKSVVWRGEIIPV